MKKAQVNRNNQRATSHFTKPEATESLVCLYKCARAHQGRSKCAHKRRKRDARLEDGKDMKEKEERCVVAMKKDTK